MPDINVHSLLHRLYPYTVMMGKEGQTAVTDALKVRSSIHKQNTQLMYCIAWENWTDKLEKIT